MDYRKEPRKKKSQVTPPGIDPGTDRLVAQSLNHYATPGQSGKIATVKKFNYTIFSAVICDNLLWKIDLLLAETILQAEKILSPN